MSRLGLAFLSTILVSSGLLAIAARASDAQEPSPVASQPTRPTTPSEPQDTLVKEFCVGCHNDQRKPGGLTLASFDPTRAGQQSDATEVAERVIRKLRVGMMPPPGARRPDSD